MNISFDVFIRMIILLWSYKGANPLIQLHIPQLSRVLPYSTQSFSHTIYRPFTPCRWSGVVEHFNWRANGAQKIWTTAVAHYYIVPITTGNTLAFRVCYYPANPRLQLGLRPHVFFFPARSGPQLGPRTFSHPSLSYGLAHSPSLHLYHSVKPLFWPCTLVDKVVSFLLQTVVQLVFKINVNIIKG